MSVVGGKANIADQRSSKSAVGSLFASTVRPFNKVVPSVQGKCDLMAAPVAATVSRATATSPVIVRCFVIRTSSSSKPTRVGHGNFAKVPVVHHGPYEYSNPLVEEDWLAQTRYVEGQEAFVQKH